MKGATANLDSSSHHFHSKIRLSSKT